MNCFVVKAFEVVLIGWVTPFYLVMFRSAIRRRFETNGKDIIFLNCKHLTYRRESYRGGYASYFKWR